MKNLYDSLISISEEEAKIPGGTFTEPKGAFKEWLESDEGQKALAKGIKDETEHTTDKSVARQIAIDHLKKNRKEYDKVSEGLWDNKQDFHHDGTDDLVDPTDDPLAHEDTPKVTIDMAIQALRNPTSAKRMAARDPASRGKLVTALNMVVSQASQLLKAMPQAATEAAMGFSGSTCVDGNPGDKGSGIPIVQPGGVKKMKFTNAKLKIGKPSRGMLAPNTFIGTKSAFAKGTM